MAKFNTNSNTYIIIYSVVMVVVVAVLLSVASLSLQSRQYENMLNEKKDQIVKALGENPAETPYDSIITEAVGVVCIGTLPCEGHSVGVAGAAVNYAGVGIELCAVRGMAEQESLGGLGTFLREPDVMVVRTFRRSP